MSSALRVTKGAFGRVALLDMNRPLVRHAHPHCHVLLKIEGADTQFAVQDRLVPLRDDNAVLVNAWQPHAYTHYPGQPSTVIMALYIEPTWLGAFRSNWGASGAPDFFVGNAGAITPRLRRLARALADAMVHEPDQVEDHQRLLAELMIAVIERFTAWREAPASYRLMAGANGLDHRIHRAVTRMRASPGTVSDMDDLACHAGLSRAHFFRLFETSLGVSPRVYLNVVRIEQAIHLVTESEATFAAISERMGFSVPAHFSRFFHDHTGSSPSMFRTVAKLRSDNLRLLGKVRDPAGSRPSSSP